jgi:hypothetical protein
MNIVETPEHPTELEARLNKPELAQHVVGTCVHVIDEPGPGGAHHEYVIGGINAEGEPITTGDKFARIKFQKGGVQEAGVNGCSNEDLLGAVMHRLSCFQAGAFPCEENRAALQHIERALQAMYRRTQLRESRGVEGKQVA